MPGSPLPHSCCLAARPFEAVNIPSTWLTPRRLLTASVLAALITIGLKTAAWWLTDSVGLLSDAMESLVNLASAVFGLMMVTVAARPADEARQGRREARGRAVRVTRLHHTPPMRLTCRRRLRLLPPCLLPATSFSTTATVRSARSR